ncbi:MAG: DNA mismatch repair endonuclease MutL [Treponema sp.]|nr:DNA mismatch repair endonuclease MutL [Treponema sp.]
MRETEVNVIEKADAMKMLNKGHVYLLPPEEARKIAAGEVIDRPAALVREFLDNAIDAGSSLIEVLIEGGGTRRVEVIDDGNGMDRGDLELCWYTHATSKIHSIEDLSSTETLGFRGEALAAAAAVSRLEILTSIDGREAWYLEVGPGEVPKPRIEQSSRGKGTSVRALGVFDTIPARKRFMKREWSESKKCRDAFTEKAMAFPNIGFRFIQDGKLNIFLPPVSSLKERFAAVLLNRNEGTFLHEIGAAGTDFSITIVLGSPALSRNDRRQQYIFANGRRIQDFSLLQALEYGVQGWFPNSAHPIGAVYIDIDPALADFNIHPAKREVRFADSGAIHHAISSALRDFIHHRNLAAAQEQHGTIEELNFLGEAIPRSYSQDWNSPDANESWGPGSGSSGNEAGALAMEALLGNRSADISRFTSTGNGPYPGTVAENSPSYGIRYAGKAFDVFILIEKNNQLFLIDQHAAHERILYERFISHAIPQQELLVPIPFRTESEEDDRFLMSRQNELARLGIILEGDNGTWRIEALPVNWQLGDAETIKELLNLKNAGENIAEHWAATLSCHYAIKEGEYLDETTALTLADAALKLPVPRCPHGRPIWVEISQEELFRAVRRL